MVVGDLGSWLGVLVGWYRFFVLRMLFADILLVWNSFISFIFFSFSIRVVIFSICRISFFENLITVIVF